MIDWQLIAVGIIVAGALVWTIVGFVRQIRRRGRGSCNCGCSGCSLADSCDKEKKKKR